MILVRVAKLVSRTCAIVWVCNEFHFCFITNPMTNQLPCHSRAFAPLPPRCPADCLRMACVFADHGTWSNRRCYSKAKPEFAISFSIFYPCSIGFDSHRLLSDLPSSSSSIRFICVFLLFTVTFAGRVQTFRQQHTKKQQGKKGSMSINLNSMRTYPSQWVPRI